MANINEADVKQGIEVGIRRCREEFDVTSEPDSEMYELLVQLLRDWPNDLSVRFILYFTEMATIASTFRSHNNYPPLDRQILKAQLGVTEFFFDSFVHK